MKLRLASVLLFALSFTASASAGTVTGVVQNGTTGKPAAGVDVVLIQLSAGMETVANTKTDAQGRYRLESPTIGVQPMLVRAIYRGMNFHQPLPPGKDTADVQVFEPTTDVKSVSVSGHFIVFQPNGNMLLVGEEFDLRNDSKPPAAYYKSDGNFEFELPEGAQIQNVSAWGPSRMPVTQGTMDRGKNRYAIAFAMHPGDNGVRFSYQLPYPANKAEVKTSSSYPAAQVAILAPPSVQISSAGFQPGGTEQGMSIYSRDLVTANTPVDISVSGTAPPPSTSGQQDTQPDPVNGRDTGVPVQAVPGRLDSLKWIFLGGFGALFALGAIFLWRRSVLTPAGGPQNSEGYAGKGSGPRQRSPQANSAPPLVSSPAAGTDTVAEVERQVTHSLDELKDTLFKLELRHQAGTISEEDYARERARAEKILRDLVRG
jgi:hypothetical protein